MQTAAASRKGSGRWVRKKGQGRRTRDSYTKESIKGGFVGSCCVSIWILLGADEAGWEKSGPSTREES